MGALKRWWQTTFDTGHGENRRAPRSPFTGMVEIRTIGGGVTRGVARDLSLTGIGVLAAADLQVGERVLLRYEHPRSLEQRQAMERRAIVRGHFGNRFGFEFEQADGVGR